MEGQCCWRTYNKQSQVNTPHWTERKGKRPWIHSLPRTCPIVQSNLSITTNSPLHREWEWITWTWVEGQKFYTRSPASTFGTLEVGFWFPIGSDNRNKNDTLLNASIRLSITLLACFGLTFFQLQAQIQYDTWKWICLGIYDANRFFFYYGISEIWTYDRLFSIHGIRDVPPGWS